MGAAVYIKLERPIPGFDHAALVDGKAMAKEWDSLNDLAGANGLISLETFVSTGADDLANLIGDAAIEEAKIEIPPETWFESQQGLSAIKSLTDSVKRANMHGENIQRDLDAYSAVLQAAATRNIRFHFAFDF
jgi:hypothetical protein